ncbi:phosphotransferase family protein [Frankia sp. Cj5]|uniref:phosphotransferase family protein n=1 Tax=Frankia sp. Cj5 TaxID=2880978 RepID=UPI001EF50A85|nr:phosphotransferase family protein [Frankia sp. Cj5]
MRPAATPVINLDELARRVRSAAAAAAGAGAGAGGPAGEVAVEDLVELTGGQSGHTFAASLVDAAGGRRRVVLKVATPGVSPVRNRDVLRQARLLRALAAVPDIRVPRVLFGDPGHPPGIPPLFAMDFIDGDSYEPIMDTPRAPLAPAAVRGRFAAAARMLAAMQAISPVSVGLGDERPVSLADEVGRWERALDTVEQALRPRHSECAAALRARLPAELAPVVVHGDWRLGNMLAVGGDITAVIDWEIWTVGDPRLDLAWFLSMCGVMGSPIARFDPPGVPSAAAVLDTYEQARGTAVADLRWFDALVHFKSAATLSLIVKHNRRRPSPDPSAERYARAIPGLIESALALLGS